MTPSNKWFPAGLQDRVAWYSNFQAQMAGGLGTTLGFTAPELLSIGNDNSVMDLIGSISVTLDVYTEAMRAYRRTVTEGEIGDPAATFPPDVSFGPPAPVPTGIYERLDHYVKRIRSNAAFNEEIGALLDINPASSTTPVIGSVPPKLEATTETGNVVIIKFVKAGSDGIFLQTNIDGGGWTDQGRFVRSPATLEIPGNESHTPSSVQLRARFIDGNTPVGVLCDIVTVQTIP